MLKIMPQASESGADSDAFVDDRSDVTAGPIVLGSNVTSIAAWNAGPKSERPQPALEGGKMSPTIMAFLENETALKRFLGRMLPTESDVEDVAQETFIRAFAASAMQTVLMPKAFLFRIAKNLALNERSRMWNTTTTFVGDSAELDDMGIDDDAVSGEDRLDSHRKIRLLEEAIAQLPTQCRRVFQLRKIEELSHKEIAAEMGISVSTVEKHIATGLVRCRKYLADRGYEIGGALRGKSEGQAEVEDRPGRGLATAGDASVQYHALMTQAF
jgi:RNA polymerase sigma factor (sigma-70 family)